MLSRVANSIYWMSRSIERAENVARFVDVNLNLMLDLPQEQVDQWRPIVDTSGDFQSFTQLGFEPTQENVIYFLTFEERNPNSIVSCLQSARENARSVRSVISSEMWEQLNSFYLMVKAAAADSKKLDLNSFFTRVKMASHLFVGVTDATMSHGEAWHFNRLGRLQERADKTSRILDVKYFILLPRLTDVGTALDDVQWSALLKSASALEMYRKRYGRIAPNDIAEFLILDREFPRAIRFCLFRCEESLRAISGSPPGMYTNPAERKLGRLRSELDYTTIDEIIEAGLHEYLDRFQADLNQVGDSIFETFFALRPLSKAAQQQ
ncbi:MAG: alpha-E domain-containing protein [Blastocatellia bacterium]|nr:alpha-E domain-containing protein [Blastocatellia bacterium]